LIYQHQQMVDPGGVGSSDARSARATLRTWSWRHALASRQGKQQEPAGKEFAQGSGCGKFFGKFHGFFL
jgi:hypothetical protein